MSDLLLMILAIIIAFILVGIVLKLLRGALKVVVIIVIAILVFGFLAGINFTDRGAVDNLTQEENQTYVEWTQEENSVTGKITGMVTKVTNPDWWESKVERKVGENLITSANTKTIIME